MGTSSITEQQRAAETFWSKRPNLAAVKNDRIYVVDSDMVLRLGPRLPQGVEMIASCLYPDIFKQKSAAVHPVTPKGVLWRNLPRKTPRAPGGGPEGQFFGILSVHRISNGVQLTR
jgi:hypothetical protein